MPYRHTARPSGGTALWLFLLSVLFPCAFLCDAPRASAQEYVFRAYRQTSGLENLAVNSIASDHQGFLWAGTENGVYRFLGSSFQRFGAAQGIPEPYITQVFAANDGTFWAASDANLYRWGGQTFQPAASQPLKMRNGSSMASEGPGSLLVISLGKLYHLRYGPNGSSPASGRLEPFFSADQLAAHPALSHLGAIHALPDGTLWMACAKMLCSRNPNGTLTEWGEPQGVAPEFYRSILQDRQGAVWAVALKHIVALLPGAQLPGAPNHSQPVFHPSFSDRSLPQTAGNGVYARLPIACDPMGRVVVSMAGGVARWDGSGWQTIGKANGLPPGHVTTLLFDERGNLWMGSIGHGLYHWIGYDDWQGWIDNQGLPSANIWSIGPFDGSRIWIGTEKGLALLDTASGLAAEPRFAKDWPYGQVTGIMAAPGDPTAGNLLITTLPGKVLKVEGHPARVTLIADLQEYIYRLFRDPSGRTFLLADSAVLDGSAVFDRRSRPRVQNSSAASASQPSSPASPLSPVPQIKALLGPRASVSQACLSPDGAVWFFSDIGLVRLAREANRDVWTRPLLQGFPDPLPRLGDMTCSKDGGVWLSTADGIWHAAYSPEPRATSDPRTIPDPKAIPDPRSAAGTASNAGRLTATKLLLPKALQSVAVVDLLADSRGWLWVGSDDGVLAWNGSSWRRFTQEDGLIWNDINDGKMKTGPDGSIWVASSGGLSRILHPERMFDAPSPRIAIVEARMGERPLPLEGGFELPWSRQDMSFQFAAPDTINRAGLRFHYRLAGLQPDFIESRDQTAHFLSLPPGEYTFEVYAQDDVSGAHSGTIARGFRVRPPWWRTWWFYTLCGIASALVIASIFRLRTRHLHAQKRRLEGMVLERTSQLEASREELRRQATHDGLTGLLNRVAVLEAFDQELARARRDGTPVTLVLADIDHFKQINDTHGHLAGDEALRRFSASLAAAIRSYDHVGRYGGEEFLLVLVGVDSGGVDARLAALHKSISGLNVIYDGAEFVVNCSLGVVQLEDLAGGSDQKLALAAADEALYEAKRAGRNRFIFGHLASGTLP